MEVKNGIKKMYSCYSNNTSKALYKLADGKIITDNEEYNV